METKKGRANCQPCPSPAGVKSVTFDEDVIETSIGGTQSTGRIKLDHITALKVVNSKSDGKKNLMFSEDVAEVPSTPKTTKVECARSEILSVEEKTASFTTMTDCFRTPNGTPTKSRRHTLESKMFNTPDCYRVVQMETPRKFDLSYDDSTDLDDDDDCTSVMVAVRVRPPNQRELSDPSIHNVVSMCGNETTVTTDSGSAHRFTYDFSFWSCDKVHGEFASQSYVYNQLAKPLLAKAFEGYNTCLFAYGQTGSGKSYSMMGHGSEVGIIPRFCEELFSRVEHSRDKKMVKIAVEISFFEIYNEKIHDLLASSKDKGGKKATLKVREHPVLGPYVEGLSTFVVNSFEDVEGWITLGNKNRATAATGMNDKSSRSHSVFTIVMTQTRTERLEGKDHDSSVNSKINLVDLAGSERQSQAQTTGERLREGANINKSLMTLGKVISLLSEQSTMTSKKRKIFIPYRDSVLTWLLKESLGGNSKTAMIATISPVHQHIDETLSTLRYAQQARSIVNMVRINEDPKARIIRELRAEIEKLQARTGQMGDDSHTESWTEIAILRERLLAKEKQMDDMSRSWQDRFRQAEARKLQESQLLEKSGIAMKVDPMLPKLVNLNEDPQLSETLLYIIKAGQTRVGRMQDLSQHDIQLNGALIADNHCIINNVEGVINITPIGDAPTYVNGTLITDPTTLHHADRVILGGDHYFRFSHPQEVQKNKKTTSSEIKDFEFAKQELLCVQEARLQQELEAARRKAQEEIERQLEKAKKEAAHELNQQRSGYEDKLAGYHDRLAGYQDKLAQLEKALKDQSCETQKVEESRQEAEDLINQLKKQKMMLEQEVLVGRKRQELEEKAAEMVPNAIVSRKSRLLELMEVERLKLSHKVESLKQTRAEMIAPVVAAANRQKIPDSVAARKDLYRTALLVREANKISQYLKKNMTFSREDVMEGDEVTTLIRVTNTKHNSCTLWTMSKFEERLTQMKDLYQNEDGTSSDEDEVFNNPEDNWERDSLLASPLSGVNGLVKSPLLSPACVFRSGQLGSGGSFKRSSTGSSLNMSISTFLKTCKLFVSSSMESFHAIHLEESIADKMLASCQTMKIAVTAILDMPPSADDSAREQNVCVQSRTIEMLTSLQLLSTLSTLWAAMCCDLDSHMVKNLLQKVVEQVKAIGSHTAMFLQGCENELASVIYKYGTKIVDCLLSLCKSCGELALATGTRMLRLENAGADPDLKMGHDVYQAFLSGSDRFLDKAIQSGLQSLEDCETRIQDLTNHTEHNLKVVELPQHVEIVVATSKVLLQKCQEIQEKEETSKASTGTRN
ncbi:kinesin-like protein KIF14 isoform X3 [Gigantopelta aegis]|uniref:kinesin-like protein KIF14 isoform X3 n=1 Tax=Gigantopelta aegis TaxID=1735272 RepID=UPI001B88B191|nr:kinesin-like protein KIF14 isoform X3 [Gigantopelta aegis]